MATPARPRQSGIPGPGRTSSIPTPGGSRSRSNSNVYQTHVSGLDDISQAFADAIKANDPSKHRRVPPNITTTASLSPPHSLPSGRRSVAGRPSSSASNYSTSRVYDRAKTPISARSSSRPPSRQAAVEPLPKAPRFFEVGENVRIESLGFEGTLRYIGEIEGKPGLWAGVELSGGFTGKGKNDGAVGGKQYFSCPDKCGVFVATSKLSAPTVRPGGIPRPSSVASSRGGRATPASSGRITPVTPSTGGRIPNSLAYGRATPSSTTGTVRPKLFKTPTSRSTSVSLSGKITEGSRASKYMTMTAQQLSSRDHDVGADSPTRKSYVSPTMSRTFSSPTRASGSPFSTPKALNGRPSTIGSSPSLPSLRTRSSISTPRARIPSGIAMPPPPSPKLSQSQSPGRDGNGNGMPSGSLFSLSRPDSSASSRSVGADDQSTLELLQSRLEAVEYENERLRAASEADSESGSSTQRELEHLRLEQQVSLDKCSLLEVKLSDYEARLNDQSVQIETLRSENKALTVQLEQVTIEVQESIAARKAESQDHLLELEVFQEQTNRLNQQRDEIDQANMSKIQELEDDLVKARLTIEDERKELGTQIDELRIAGQETIALYEERLSAANDQRYELQQRIATLESSLSASRTEEDNQPPHTQATSFADQIDNETLRDQVQYLQKKSTKLEEQLEDTRAALERDVNSYQDKIARIRQEDEQTKRDLVFKTREVEQLLLSETSARNRIEEIEEALRESTVALENARGEVEILRSEIANLDILINDASEDDLSSKLASFTKRITAERAQHQQEIIKLQDTIRDLHSANEKIVNASSSNFVDLTESHRALDPVIEENAQLRERVSQLQEDLAELTQALEARTTELESARKKALRDASSSTSGIDLSRSKSESSTAREEVAGLKHIVQDLQKENVALSQQIKLVQSENQLLVTETEKLRQEVQILEENLDNDFHDDSSTKIGSPVQSNGRTLQDAELTSRSEGEIEQMRKRMSEMEMKHARTVHDLNKEISELEALVESKIYREDELEQEIERLKEKVAKHKKSSKGGPEESGSRHRLSTASTTSSVHTENTQGPEVCEICERPGHDIFSCSLLKEDVGAQVICEDCESPGHVAADCPHSQEYDVTGAMTSGSQTHNAPPPEDQPRPDPALLNTTPPHHSLEIDETAKVSLVPPEFKEQLQSPSPTSSPSDYTRAQNGGVHSGRGAHGHETTSGNPSWLELANHYLIRPGVAGGLIGLVNIGLLASVGRAFYVRPHLRRDTAAISSALATAFALVSVEGYAADKYRKTPRGQAEERRAKKEGALIFNRIRHDVLRLGVLGGIVGLVNVAVLGALGFVSYQNWNTRWDRRAVSAVSLCFLTLWGGEGFLVEKYIKR